MIKNYLKIAFRSLVRSKVHSLINIFGLSLGIMCCILIVLFVRDELTFDSFHKKAERIYRVWGREDYGENQVFFWTVTPFPMGPALKENLPEIESQVRINSIGTQIKVGDQQFTESVAIAGRDFFRMFDFNILKGDRDRPLEEQNNVVLTESMAKKYFGDDDPINKTISIQLGEVFEEFRVVAVTEDVPTNSSVRYSILVSDLIFPKLYSQETLTSSWFNITPETYVMLQEGTDQKTVEGKFPSLFKTLIGEQRYNESKYTVGLQPIETIHLDTSYPEGNSSVSDPKYSYILGAIAGLILVVACINFVTLSVGRSLKRAKEVGIRKVVGAHRKQLIAQFIGEAIIVTTISLTLGFAVAILALPVFNDLAGKTLVMELNGFMILTIGILLAIIGLIAGSYPAFVLSRFKPASILKGGPQSGASKQGLRKVLVGVQLVLAIFLISSTLVMRQQLTFLQNKNLGFNKEQLAVVQLNVPRGGGMVKRVAAGFEKAEQFKSILATYPEIVASCGSSHDFGSGGWVEVGYTDDNNVYRTFNFNTVDEEYIDVMKMEMAYGRNFSEDVPSDVRRGVLVNEAFAKEYGMSDAVGKKIPGKNFADHEIIGVVKDFNFTSLYTKVPSAVLVMDNSILLKGSENINIGSTPIPKIIARMAAGELSKGIERLEEAWNKIAPGEEFTFSFVDQTLAEQYRSEQNLGKIIGIATLLAILIGSMGLYGLASLAMQSRIKEISIRKVMGATEGSLLVLLSKDYLILVLVALVLSVPITVYLMKGWLTTFEYRVSIGWEVFAMAGGISLIVALSTIGYQTLKTAWTQPAESLKYE
jgi:putative ABC transport system permease protein